MKFICKTGEVCYTYKDYLNTKHWNNIKNKFYNDFRNASCQICNNKTNLNLHHKTYKRIGKEYISDLIVLCKYCHNYIHKHKYLNKWLEDSLFKKHNISRTEFNQLEYDAKEVLRFELRNNRIDLNLLLYTRSGWIDKNIK